MCDTSGVDDEDSADGVDSEDGTVLTGIDLEELIPRPRRSPEDG